MENAVIEPSDEIVKFIVEEGHVKEDEARQLFEASSVFFKAKFEWVASERAAGRPIRNEHGALRNPPLEALQNLMEKYRG